MILCQAALVGVLGRDYVLGLKADGTIIAAGELPDKLYPVLKWTDIIAISTSAYLVVGLKEDGSVICCPKSDKAPSELDWRDIVAITTRGTEAIGLKSDGTVVSSISGFPQEQLGSCSTIWTISRKSAASPARRGRRKSVLPRNGRARKSGSPRKKRFKKKKERIQALHQEMDSLQAELAALRGLFTGRKRRELEARIEDANRELRKLEASVR